MPNEHNSAFPWVSHGGIHEHQFTESGLTKREYFAAMAMQGLLSHQDFDYCPLTHESIKKVIDDSLCLANAMIKASQVQS